MGASQNVARLRAMLELAATEIDFVVRLEQLDADPWLLSCGNGILDLRTGKLRASDPADLISRGTDVNYNPKAPRARARGAGRAQLEATTARVGLGSSPQVVGVDVPPS